MSVVASIKWSLQGAGPLMPAPHIVLEVLVEDDSRLNRISPERVETLWRHLSAKPPSIPVADAASFYATCNIALQQRLGHDAERIAMRELASGAIHVAIEHRWPKVAEEAFKATTKLLGFAAGLATKSAGDLDHIVTEFVAQCLNAPRYDQIAIRSEAVARDIPVTLQGYGALRFGHGLHARRMDKAITDKTSLLAAQLADDKTLTIRALQAAGLPVPQHKRVRTLEKARKAAQDIGYPVVVKPIHFGMGAGVTVGVTDDEQLEAALAVAQRLEPVVAVEKFIPGDTFRLLVVDGTFRSALRTEPTPVKGDGTSTVAELVAAINRHPHRGPNHFLPLCTLELDGEADSILLAQGLDRTSVLPAGQTIHLRTASNVSRGGLSTAVTDSVHPDNRELAELCAEVVGLDLIGIDFRTTDVSRSWKEGDCAIIEVNQNPWLTIHFTPAKGRGDPIATFLLDYLFPGSAEKHGMGRIPIAAITGTNGKTTTTRLIAHIMRGTGKVVGCATTDEAVAGERTLKRWDLAGHTGAHMILGQPDVEVAVLETARGGVIQYGLGFDASDVAVVTNIGTDHLGEHGVETLEEMARVKQVVAQSAKGTAVLNGDDPLCLAMRPNLKARNIVLFSMTPDNADIRAHVENGGTAFVCGAQSDTEKIGKLTAGGFEPWLAVGDLPMAFGGIARHNIENALAASAAASEMGVAKDLIVERLKSFETTPQLNAGRLNHIGGFPFTLILDYAHNKPALARIGAYCAAHTKAGRRICLFTMNAGRVTPERAHEALKPLAENFTHFVPFAAKSSRYYRPGFEKVLEEGLRKAGVADDHVFAQPSEHHAFDRAFALAGTGDLVLVIAVPDPAYYMAIIEERRKTAHSS